MKRVKKLLLNKWFCLFWLVAGCLYITVYGFLKNPFDYTASMIGLDYPWLFRLWGIMTAISIALNTVYMYKRYSYSNKGGYACLILSAACIFTTTWIPSTEEFGLQLVAHWSTALLFGVFDAIAIALLLLHKSKEHKGFRITFYVFLGMLALMIALLVAFGKNGVIESIPMWGAYAVLYLVNFTDLYIEKKPA